MFRAMRDVCDVDVFLESLSVMLFFLNDAVMMMFCFWQAYLWEQKVLSKAEGKRADGGTKLF